MTSVDGNGVHHMDEKFSLLDYLTIVLRWRKFIVLNFVIVTGMAVVISQFRK